MNGAQAMTPEQMRLRDIQMAPLLVNADVSARLGLANCLANYRPPVDVPPAGWSDWFACGDDLS